MSAPYPPWVWYIAVRMTTPLAKLTAYRLFPQFKTGGRVHTAGFTR